MIQLRDGLFLFIGLRLFLTRAWSTDEFNRNQSVQYMTSSYDIKSKIHSNFGKLSAVKVNSLPCIPAISALQDCAGE